MTLTANILGPDPARGAVATRPAKTTSPISLPYWFNLCTGANDPARTKITTDFLNDVAGTLRGAIDSSGAAQSETPADSDQMLAEASARYASLGTSGTCTGSANVYAIAARGAAIVPKALFSGMRVTSRPPVANSGPVTADVFALGSRKVLLWDGTALTGGELSAGRDSEWEYDEALDSGAGAWRIAPWSLPGFYELFIRTDTTYTVGPGQQFASVQAALDSLRYKLVAPDVTVTLLLSAGQFTVTAPISLPHLNGVRIVIKGQPPGALPVSADVVASAATTLATLRSRFPTEIVCSACNGLEALRNACVRIENLLFTGTATFTGILAGDSINAPAGSTAAFYGAGQVTAVNCWAHGFAIGWWSRQQGNISGNGFGASHCASHGLIANNNGYATGLKGIFCRNGTGLYARDRGYIELTGTQIDNNTNHGVLIGQGARVNLGDDGIYHTITGNGAWGVRADNSGSCTIDTMTLSGNASGSASAAQGSQNLLTGCTGVGTLSPAANTVGNNQSVNIVV